MPRIVRFEISCDEPQRAIDFYINVFGWDVQKWDGPFDYWLVQTGARDEPGIDGAIMPRENPDVGIVNTIDVPDADDFLNKIKTNGGVVLTEKMAIPTVGWFAYCKDTEGNTFGIMQMDPEAL